jgi:hypothetical protein
MQILNTFVLLLPFTSISLAASPTYHADQFGLKARYADPRDVIGMLAAEMGEEVLRNTHPKYRDCMDQVGDFAKRDIHMERREARGGGGHGKPRGKGKKGGTSIECAKYLKG